jgi:molybdopterin synthase catalytic subunit
MSTDPADTAADALSFVGAVDVPVPGFPELSHRVEVSLGVSSAPLQADALTVWATHPSAGAVCSFVGTTRDSHAGRGVARLDYEAHAPMALGTMRKLCVAAAAAAVAPAAAPQTGEAAAPHCCNHSRSAAPASAADAALGRRLTRVACWHRIGTVPVAEASVVVVVSSPHRREALVACADLIDQVKAVLPVWKKEWYTDGSCGWKENAEWSLGNPTS